MCRNIKPLFNFEPPASESEINAASLQYVRKISGIKKPSKANEAVYLAAVEAISKISENLLSSLKTKSPAKDRIKVTAITQARNTRRFLN